MSTPTLLERAQRAKRASQQVAPLRRDQKDAALAAISRALRGAGEAAVSPADVLGANARDLEEAKVGGLSEAMIDRLRLDEGRLEGIASAVDEIAQLEDPVGASSGSRLRPNGIRVGQVQIPLGVIAMIYESRPNVTVDAAALTLKSGNAVLLRGGKEAKHSNAVLGELVRGSLATVGIPEDAVQVVPPLSREDTKALLGMTGLIDLCIPRGGEGLIRFVVEHARIPVVQHFKGVCHLYVDEGADLEMAANLIENGKGRPSVCNALECVLVHRAEVAALMPLLRRMISAGVELRCDEASLKHLPGAVASSDEDYGCEFLAPILAVKTVASLDDALGHIAQFGSLHTEVICTRDHRRGERFLREADASCVMINASTRFNDGGQLGLGAEIGISTSKLHAFGPMGLESLTARKWVVYGDGHTR